jgi:hypothetical protein
MSVRQVLDRVCLDTGLDYDERHGVVWVGPPERMWRMGKADPLPEANEWTSAKESKTGAKLANLQANLEFKDAPLSDVLEYLRELTLLSIVLDRRSDPAILGRKLSHAAKDISVEEHLALLTLPRGLDVRLEEDLIILFDRSRPPKPFAWRSQKLEGADAALLKTLRDQKTDLHFREADLKVVTEFLRETLEIRIRTEDGLGARKISLAIRQATLLQILELLVPHGADLRIEKGEVVIFKEKE